MVCGGALSLAFVNDMHGWMEECFSCKCFTLSTPLKAARMPILHD